MQLATTQPHLRHRLTAYSLMTETRRAPGRCTRGRHDVTWARSPAQAQRTQTKPHKRAKQRGSSSFRSHHTSELSSPATPNTRSHAPVSTPPPPTMFAARAAARQTPRMALARAPARAGRRNYSSESPKQFAGAEDNEFNRERARIAEHGGESGEFWRKLSL